MANSKSRRSQTVGRGGLLELNVKSKLTGQGVASRECRLPHDDLQSIDIESDRTQNAAGDVHDVPGGDEMRMAGGGEQRFCLSAVERENRDLGVDWMVRCPRADGEQYRPTIGQDFRPRMPPLAGADVRARE